jgi:hypothetical protein
MAACRPFEIPAFNRHVWDCGKPPAATGGAVIRKSLVSKLLDRSSNTGEGL